MEDNAGRRIFPAEASEYQLLEEIGHGVSAIVYRAICKPFKEIVAVKCLDLERCNSNLENISHEAQLMSLIDHQSVIKAYCSFVVDHFLWVVMPYMDGGSCLHIMKVSYPDGFEEVLIATILKETLKALDYLHRQGHIHRDVKAGNILIDANGVVKLGDFGVSACMFNRGDRQRSRNTFVGTPCWMAPEVMEQKHGYDFRADIWSFGITALELAHGHAPFSKYPPIKVLLMTIQNAPPGLDHERDKRFSKAFKDMISMCLVKDPTKRPTAAKLLKHSFFKQAKSKEYISQHLLQNLSSLWEREKILMDKDAARLAEKKIPYLEQEEKSQNEYKRSVSAWNFNVEDLKVQAALIQDDDEAPSSKDGDEFQRTNLCSDDDSCGTSSLFTSPSPPPSIHIDPGRSHPLMITHSLKGDAVPIVCGDSVPCNQRVSSILVPPISLKSCGNGPGHRYSGKKESKQIGRFDVFEGDLELESPGWHECVLQKRFVEDQQRERQRSEGQGREIRTERNRDVRRAASGPLLPERVISPLKNACRSRTLEREMSSESSSDTFVELRGLGTHQKEHSHSGPTEATPDQQCTNGCVGPLVRPIPGNKDAIEDKAKRPPFHRKGRFSITSTDTKTLEDAASSNAAQRPIKMQDTLFHKSASVGDCSSLSEQKLTGAVQLSSTSVFSSTDTSSVAVAILVPHLQNLLLQTATQQETICNMLKTISPADAMNGHCVSQLSFSPMKTGAGDESVANPPTDRERELLHQVSELQWKVTSLQSELQDIKLRNVQLERHLNAIYNRGEEERIRREEAAKGDS